MLLLLLCAMPASSGELRHDDDDEDWGDEDWGDDEVGFGDFEAVAVPEAPPPPKPVSLGGTLRKDDALWSERSFEFAKARQTLDLWASYKKGNVRAELAAHGELDLIPVFQEQLFGDTSRFDDASLREYGTQLFPREAYVAVSEGDWELKVGNQIVAWGEANLLSTVDVVNPRDLREPGLADLDDIRLPVLGARVAWFHDGHRVELMAVPTPSWGLRSPPNGPFGLLPGVLDDAPDFVTNLLADKQLAWAHEPGARQPGNTQWFGRWTMKGEGLDMGVYGASVLDQQGVLALPEFADLAGESVAISLQHRRYGLVGMSAAAPVGGFVLRGEAAANIDRAFNTGDLEATVPAIDVDQGQLLSAMFGASRGFGNLSVDLELSKGAFQGGPPRDLLFRADSGNAAVRLGYTAMRERLRIDVVGIGFGWDLRFGGLARASATYELRDGMKLAAGVISYRPGSERGPVTGLDSHDRVFWQYRWDF